MAECLCTIGARCTVVSDWPSCACRSGLAQCTHGVSFANPAAGGYTTGPMLRLHYTALMLGAARHTTCLTLLPTCCRWVALLYGWGLIAALQPRLICWCTGRLQCMQCCYAVNPTQLHSKGVLWMYLLYNYALFRHEMTEHSLALPLHR